MNSNLMSFQIMFILRIILALASLSILGCLPTSRRNYETIGKITLLKSSEQEHLDFSHSTIEEIILSIPVEPSFRTHFVAMVSSARANLPENRGMGIDQLYIGSDGSRCAHSFALNRENRRLDVTEHCNDAIPPFVTKYHLYYANEGWVKSDRVLILHEVNAMSFKFVTFDYWDGVGG